MDYTSIAAARPSEQPRQRLNQLSALALGQSGTRRLPVVHELPIIQQEQKWQGCCVDSEVRAGPAAAREDEDWHADLQPPS